MAILDINQPLLNNVTVLSDSSGGSTYKTILVKPNFSEADFDLLMGNFQAVVQVGRWFPTRTSIGRGELFFCGVCRDHHYRAWDQFNQEIEPYNGYGFNDVQDAIEAMIAVSSVRRFKGRWYAHTTVIRKQRRWSRKWTRQQLKRIKQRSGA